MVATLDITAEMVERAAKALCRHSGLDPLELVESEVLIHPTDDLDTFMDELGFPIIELWENGERPPDGHRDGKPCSFMWRGFIKPAQDALMAGLWNATFARPSSRPNPP